jgi:hypothetical protein
MSNTSRSEYLQTIQPRYRKASKIEKNKILFEFCNICGYNRKCTISQTSEKYGYLIRNHLLKAIIFLWLPFYPYHITEKVNKALLSISPTTIDRLLSNLKILYNKSGLATI